MGNAYKLCPLADILYHADERWWLGYPDALKFEGKKLAIGYTVSMKGKDVFKTLEHLGVDYISQSESYEGLETKPGHIVMGNNSGYQALGVAVQYKPKSIIMLGFDLCPDPRDGENKGKQHFDGDHPEGVKVITPWDGFVSLFNTLPPVLAKMGISVYNCSEGSALTCFEKIGLGECLTRLGYQ